MRPLNVLLSPGATQLAVGVLFSSLVAVQWRGPGFLPGTDAIAYITGGVNLVRNGTFTNPAGDPELWFPPVYPILIGAASLGGWLDPATAAHLISASCAFAILFVTAHIAQQVGARGYEPALAMAILALNPIHQRAALYAWSEATATILAVCGFAIWLRLAPRSPSRQYVLLGLLVGLSYLTRPEGLLLLPAWVAVDAFHVKIRRPLLAKYAIAGAVTALVALPYVVYLFEHTGTLTLTGKTEINLASGRATYLGQFTTTYIDPVTLEIGLRRDNFTLWDEARRYVWDAARILASYWRNLGSLLALPVALGVMSFVQTRRLRFLYGGAIFVAYLLVVAVFQVKDRFLHLSLPFLSMLAARGVTRLVASGARTPERSWRTRTQVALAVVVVVGVLVQGTAPARHHVDFERTGAALFRDAGMILRQLAPTTGVVYEQWGHFGFHAEQFTRILTPNDIDTILRYIGRHERPDQPVYLALSSMEANWYHPSVRALLQSADGIPQLRREISLSDHRGTVVVYGVHVDADGSPANR